MGICFQEAAETMHQEILPDISCHSCIYDMRTCPSPTACRSVVPRVKTSQSSPRIIALFGARRSYREAPASVEPWRAGMRRRITRPQSPVGLQHCHPQKYRSHLEQRPQPRPPRREGTSGSQTWLQGATDACRQGPPCQTATPK